jgi:hypothetical protein
VKVGQCAAHVPVPAGRQVPDRPRRRQDQPHGAAQPLDPLIVGQRGHAPAQLLVRVGQRRRLLERAAHARAELEDLDLRRHDPGQQHAEQRNPRPPADDAVEPRVVGQRDDECAGAAGEAARLGLALAGCGDRSGPRPGPEGGQWQREGDRGGPRSRDHAGGAGSTERCARHPGGPCGGGPGSGSRRGGCSGAGAACARRRLPPDRPGHPPGRPRRAWFVAQRRGLATRRGAPCGLGERARLHLPASSSLRAARRCADFDRGLASTSPAVGASARRVRSSASG